MADLEINGVPVLRASISFPRVGRWVADLHVDTGDDITGSVTLASGDGSLTLQGHVQHGGVYAEYLSLRVVGGTGGLDRPVAAVYSSSTPFRTVVSSLLQGVGESLSARSDPAIMGRFLQSWARASSPDAGTALQALADSAQAAWRVQDDGSIWLGTDTYPEITLDDSQYELLRSFPSEGRDIYSGAPVPPIRPGTTLLGRRVAYVEYHLTENSAEMEVWYERGQSDDDRIHSALAGLIRSETCGVDYHALYRCQVSSQAPDGTLALVPRNSRIPAMTGVRLAQLVPGVDAVVTGGEVLLAFEDGDPARPVALPAWNGGGTISMPVKDCGVLTGTAPSSGGPVTFTYTAPDGTVQSGLQVFLSGRIKS